MKDIDDNMMSQYACPQVREQSAAVVQIESGKLMPVLIFVSILAAAALAGVAMSFQANERSERAMDQARLMERETRLMKDDLKYIRAYLSARGIHIPADHDEAEENSSGSQNHH
jgi:type II secretory pathway pseudopilin PulG